MYGKIFDSMYDGTLHGNWEAIVTLQQLIVLCTPDGMIDMTPQAISSRTSIPIKIIEKGLKVLADPDPHSRTPGEDGRRIVLMDAHRPWGWVLVNHEKYKRMQDADTIRAQTRERVQRHRDEKRAVTVGNAPKRHSESDSYSDSKDKSNVGLSPDAARQARNAELRKQASEVVAFLNEKAGRNFDLNGANADHVVARLKDGESVDDCRSVIAMKCREWRGDPKMSKYLRPETLFNRTKFATYKGELSVV